MAGRNGVAFNTSGHDNYRLWKFCMSIKRNMTRWCRHGGKHAVGVNVGVYETELIKVGVFTQPIRATLRV